MTRYKNEPLSKENAEWLIKSMKDILQDYPEGLQKEKIKTQIEQLKEKWGII